MILSPLEDAARIHGAATPDALWRYLVANVHQRAMTNTFDAIVAFGALHKDRHATALRTAQLICTDQRWRRVTSALVVDIEQSGILDEPALDQLADGFLWEDTLGWPVPDGWLRDGRARVRRKNGNPGRRGAVVDRPIRPPLRRWAAARVAAREPGRVADVFACIDRMDARAGDAIMAGLLDAAGAIPREARVALTELGCSWPSGTVRLRALKLVAESDEETALRRAASDPSGTVRAWGQKLRSRRHRPDRPIETETGGSRHTSVREEVEPPPSLFD